MPNRRSGSSRVTVETFQIGWVDLGDITAEQAAPAVTARAYATVKALTATGIVEWNVRHGYNCIETRFSTNADGEAHVVDVLVSSGEDHFVRAATLTLTGGTQTAPIGARAAAGVFVDTIVISNKAWHGDMDVVQAAGENYIARFVMDLMGYEKVLFHATTLTADKTITIEGRGF